MLGQCVGENWAVASLHLHSANSVTFRDYKSWKLNTQSVAAPVRDAGHNDQRRCGLQ